MSLYQTEDERTRIECRFDDETIWLTQTLIAELFQKDVRTINEHLVNVYDDGELDREATIRRFRIVRTQGNRWVFREIEHYNLEAILAVGFRVRSHRGAREHDSNCIEFDSIRRGVIECPEPPSGRGDFRRRLGLVSWR